MKITAKEAFEKAKETNYKIHLDWLHNIERDIINRAEAGFLSYRIMEATEENAKELKEIYTKAGFKVEVFRDPKFKTYYVVDINWDLGEDI